MTVTRVGRKKLRPKRHKDERRQRKRDRERWSLAHWAVLLAAVEGCLSALVALVLAISKLINS
ncbi:hypothetical protein GAR06_06231 [Micromonospora saelicesensis]|nr:hypothetical protein GAR06_06231 [Micromonospora saelicesensis]